MSRKLKLTRNLASYLLNSMKFANTLILFLLFAVCLKAAPAQMQNSTSKTLAPLRSNDLSDANCPKGWKIIVLNLGANGFNCESKSCSCHASADRKTSKSTCTNTKLRLKEVRLPDGADWECTDTPAGCIWCGPKQSI